MGYQAGSAHTVKAQAVQDQGGRVLSTVLGGVKRSVTEHGLASLQHACE